MSISYTVSVYNELSELSRLLELISSAKLKNEEIVVLHTYKDESEQQTENFEEIKSIAERYADTYETFHFENRFADLKNYLNSLANNEYIINFDADEFASVDTIKTWKQIINENDNDLYYIPRVNTVENYTLEDVEKYNWNINANGWINWPDYQPRIFKNNGKIKWSGNVHEQLIGYEKAIALTQHPGLAIIHHKTIEKQRQQNTLYETIKK